MSDPNDALLREAYEAGLRCVAGWRMQSDTLPGIYAAADVIPFRALRQVREPPRFKMEKRDKVADVYIYDMIGAGFFEDGVTAKGFKDDLEKMKPFDRLNVYINSPGGSVFEGTTIHNIIARQKAEKTIMIDGLAASIASVIAMSGDTIQIAANGLMMIHNPWAVAIGDAADMRKMAETLDVIRGTILDTYVNRSGHDRDALSEMMDAETWIDAETAVEIGLADKVAEPVEMAALAHHDLSAFKHPPEIAAGAPQDTSQTDGVERQQPPALIKSNARAARIRAAREGQPSE